MSGMSDLATMATGPYLSVRTPACLPVAGDARRVTVPARSLTKSEMISPVPVPVVMCRPHIRKWRDGVWRCAARGFYGTYGNTASDALRNWTRADASVRHLAMAMAPW